MFLLSIRLKPILARKRTISQQIKKLKLDKLLNYLTLTKHHISLIMSSKSSSEHSDLISKNQK